jgi:hypothetical protein
MQFNKTVQYSIQEKKLQYIEEKEKLYIQILKEKGLSPSSSYEEKWAKFQPELERFIKVVPDTAKAQFVMNYCEVKRTMERYRDGKLLNRDSLNFQDCQQILELDRNFHQILNFERYMKIQKQEQELQIQEEKARLLKQEKKLWQLAVICGLFLSAVSMIL